MGPDIYERGLGSALLVQISHFWCDLGLWVQGQSG